MRPVVAARKIADIRERVARVRALLPPSVDQFLLQRTEAEALILNLYLALQASSDLAVHAVADRGLGVPADARGGFELLSRAGLVEQQLAQRMSAAMGLRNRIAHEYGRLNLRRVHAIAANELDDLEAFAEAMADAYGL